MKKITALDAEAQSADIVAGNIAQLRSLFPEVFTEGTIDFDVLKQLLGGAVDDRTEKYGLNWHGKRAARQLALTPSLGTLRPAPADSVNWDTTRNILIEGDNLEVLKLLQKSYSGKVKLIYIDPPYNTGNDFVYPDDFRDNIGNYQRMMGHIDGSGLRLTTNAEASGRKHTNWLNMMYPRLMLARNLLREDGMILVSCDDNELENIRHLAAHIFGEEQFVVQIIWKKRSTPPNDKVIGANHDYILCFAKNINSVSLNLRERTEEQASRYRNPDNHPKGVWAPGDLMANVKGGRYVASLYFPIKNPNTGEEHFPGDNGNWRFSKDSIDKLLANNEIYFGEDGKGRPKLKRFLSEVKDGVTYPSLWDFVPLNTSGSTEMQELLGNAIVFESPKPCGLICEICKLGSDSESIVLDFFAGSGTTGHAVMELNAQDHGNRHYILVQLDEPLSVDNSEQKTAAEFCKKLGKPLNIAELTKERLRRAGKKVMADNPVFLGDIGFRVYKLDSSNIQPWDPKPDNLEGTVFDSVEHIKDGRTPDDILTELLLKLGLDLCVPIETKTIAKKKVHSIGGGVLLVCLDTPIATKHVEELALGIVEWHKSLAPAGDSQAVFRDSAFEDDIAKTNLTAILAQHGLANVRSL